MAPIHVRIDDRLLHSEVIYACVSFFGVERVILSSNLEWAPSIDRSGLPDGVAFESVPPEALGRRLGALGQVTELIVFGTTLDAKAAVSAGFKAPEFVLANRAQTAESRRLSSTYFVSSEELDALTEIAASGIAITIQRIPTTPAVALQVTALSPTSDA